MKRVAILVTASPTAAFYSQLAVLSRALQQLPWSEWEPSVHVYFGGEVDQSGLARWIPHLRGIEMHFTSATRYDRLGEWSQSDDTFRLAPRDADLLLALDADILVVRDLQPALSEALRQQSIAAVIAHYPTILPHAFDPVTGTFSVLPERGREATTTRDGWQRLAHGVIDRPLDLCFRHTLVDPSAPDELRIAPFYPNFGVVLIPQMVFGRIVNRFLEIRPRLMDRLPAPDFAAQAALALAVAESGVNATALPIRYNFPNDPIAERLYPEECRQIVIFHYLRTDKFNRHEIFTSRARYMAFLQLPLEGVDGLFQDAVRRIVGETYPFD